LTLKWERTQVLNLVYSIQSQQRRTRPHENAQGLLRLAFPGRALRVRTWEDDKTTLQWNVDSMFRPVAAECMAIYEAYMIVEKCLNNRNSGVF
jgi:hypothetical protein